MGAMRNLGIADYKKELKKKHGSKMDLIKDDKEVKS